MCKSIEERMATGYFKEEYREGWQASLLVPEKEPKNPYDYFADFYRHYDWSNGFQAGLSTCQCK
jgi:hypothetical protein